jgi:diadenosine tetraphosphate (Ap4A) HIT family hydrolase
LTDTFSPRRRACDFCDEFAGGGQNAYARTYGQAQRLITASARFCLIPSLGQIVEGHLLIVPKQHYCATADLPIEQIAELDSLCERVRDALRTTYGNCVFFEHGMRGQWAGGCGVEHAHMHAVPVAANGVLHMLAQEFSDSKVRLLEDIKQTVPGESSYLFFEDAAGDRHTFPVNNLPSQYMRKLVAESLGKSDWDWRRRGQEPELVSTVQRLSPLLQPSAIASQG